jgi:hypothetical protein
MCLSEWNARAYGNPIVNHRLQIALKGHGIGENFQSKLGDCDFAERDLRLIVNNGAAMIYDIA